LYKRRRSTVERSYADLKGHRRLDRFSGRGLARVRAQLRLQCLVHNLLVVARWQWSSNPDPPGQAIRAHLGSFNIAHD
jgi:IS5 family transposase